MKTQWSQVIARLRTREFPGRATDVTAATGPPNIQRSSVQQFISTSASDGFQSVPGQRWRRSTGPQRGVVHNFTVGSRGKQIVKALVLFFGKYDTADGGVEQRLP